MDVGEHPLHTLTLYLRGQRLYLNSAGPKMMAHAPCWASIISFAFQALSALTRTSWIAPSGRRTMAPKTDMPQTSSSQLNSTLFSG